jgi:tetratricopeptide (TPR) repeat protein
MSDSNSPASPTLALLSEEQTKVEGAPRPALVREVPLERGAQLGPYVILDVVGHGGMGIVYSAYDPRLDRRVAIKLLHPHLSSSRLGSGARARFVREAQAMARLTHPNVVAIHDVGTLDDRVFLAMEYLDGETLRTWLRTPRSWRTVLDALLEAGRGLVAAHDAGLIHRDFKPDNVLVASDGRIAVTDFGLARSATSEPDMAVARELPSPSSSSGSPSSVEIPMFESEPGLTEVGTIVGTVGYMAPEQAFSEPIDARCDQFSFCATLYQALYQEKPYESRGVEGYLEALDGGVREAPKGTSVPLRIRRVLVKGLSRHPHDRYASMRALLAALSSDPRARTRRTLAMIAVPALAIVGMAGTYRAARARDDALCSTGQAEVGAIWNPAAQDEARRAFEATNLPYATDTWWRVKTALDRYSKEWASAADHTCEASRLHPGQPAEVVTARMACLERGKRELRAVVSVFAEADPNVVENAVRATGILASPVACAEIVAGTAAQPPPSDPELRAEIDAIRTELAAADALRAAGEYTAALARLEGQVERAKSTRFMPLVADLELARGKTQEALGQPAVAIPTFDDAVIAADEGTSDDARVTAMLGLMRASMVIGQRDAARDWGRFAQAASSRLTRESAKVAFEFTWNVEMSRLYSYESRYTDAVPHADRAIALARRAPGLDALEVALAFPHLAVPLARTGRVDDALAALAYAEDTLVKTLGAGHPATLAMMPPKTYVLFYAKRYQEIIDLSGAAIELAKREPSPDRRTLGLLYNNRGFALEELHHLEPALADYEASIAVRNHAREVGTLPAIANRCRVLVYLKRFDAAAKACTDGLRLAEELLAPDQEELGGILAFLADMELHAGHPKDALGHARRGVEIFTKSSALEADDDNLAMAEFALARASWQTGDRSPEVVARAARALHTFEQKGLAGPAAEVAAWIAIRPAAR